MDLTAITGFLAILIYAALALIALWGAFCVIIVWRRVARVLAVLRASHAARPAAT